MLPAETVWKKLLGSVRVNLLAGLLFLGPLLITLLIVRLLVRWFDAIFLLLPPNLLPESVLPFPVPGLVLILALILLFLTGVLVRNYLGNILVVFWEKIIARVPLVNTLYVSSKQLVLTLTRKKNRNFKQGVLVQFPRAGTYALGFVTGMPTGELREKIPADVVNVFVPTTPNPTSGYYLLIPREEIIDLEMGVEDAFKVLVSGGLIDPEAHF